MLLFGSKPTPPGEKIKTPRKQRLSKNGFSLPSQRPKFSGDGENRAMTQRGKGLRGQRNDTSHLPFITGLCCGSYLIAEPHTRTNHVANASGRDKEPSLFTEPISNKIKMLLQKSLSV